MHVQSALAGGKYVYVGEDLDKGYFAQCTPTIIPLRLIHHIDASFAHLHVQ